MISEFNEDELKYISKLKKKELIEFIKRMRYKRISDYKTLLEKYKSAEKNLKDNPEKCGGKKSIEGYMSGIIEGMALLDELTSKTM